MGWRVWFDKAFKNEDFRLTTNQIQNSLFQMEYY